MSLNTGSKPAMAIESAQGEPENPELLTAVREGDQAAFAILTERYRRQLHVHCYRMLGSFTDAEDIIQETFLHAWRGRESFEGRSLFWTWLYRIATNLCLNAIEKRPRRLMPSDIAPPIGRDVDATRTSPQWHPEMPWIEPYPDSLLEPVAPEESEPDAVAVSRETIELAYLAAVQFLPPTQRAVLVLRDALGWSEKETADLLDTSVASVKSALQRARVTMREKLPSHRLEWAAPRATDRERSVLERFMAAYDRSDAAALTSLLCEDARQTMPPALMWFDGRDSMVAHHRRLLDGSLGAFRFVPVMANRQFAAAAYLQTRRGGEFRLSGLNVFRIEEGMIAEITSFGPELCAPFNLPTTI
jgi:RNA polymerase sigma-70 factor, ECF subfamily